MPTSRRLLISGEAAAAAPQGEPRGYCSRRLSISENTCPPNAMVGGDQLKDHNLDAKASRGGGRRTFVVVFNLLCAVLIWFLATSYKDTLASPSANQIYDFVNDQLARLKGTEARDLPLELVPPPIVPEPDDEPETLTPSILAELQVIAEVHQVKEQLLQLQQAVASKLESKADSQMARDAELEKMRSVVNDLTRRLEVLQEEAAVRPSPTPSPPPPPPPPVEEEPSQPWVNLANEQLGARIWEEKTSVRKNPTLVNTASSLLLDGPRYRETTRRLQQHRNPKVVLDEHDIRGYGDGYCYEFKSDMDSWLHFGLILPYENQMISAIQFEHVKPELDHLPAFRPVFAKLEAYAKDELTDMKTLELAYDKHGVARHNMTLSTSTDRLAFSIKCADSYSCCLYRIRVFGVFVRDDLHLS